MIRIIIALIAMTVSAHAADKCAAAPSVLTSEWIADCEDYYRSDKCAVAVLTAPAEHRADGRRGCSAALQRIDLFKKNSPDAKK